MPLWRLLAPWFGQGTLTLHPSLSDGVPASRFVPVVRSSWPARIRKAAPLQLGELAREIRSSYAAGRLEAAFDPAAFAVPLDPTGTTRVLAALMVPTRIRDLADLAGQHLRIDQGANP